MDSSLKVLKAINASNRKLIESIKPFAEELLRFGIPDEDAINIAKKLEENSNR